MNSKIMIALKAAIKKSRSEGSGAKFSSKVKTLGIELASTGVSASVISKHVGVSYATAARWVRLSKDEEPAIEIVRRASSSKKIGVQLTLRLSNGVVIESVNLEELRQVLDAVS